MTTARDVLERHLLAETSVLEGCSCADVGVRSVGSGGFSSVVSVRVAPTAQNSPSSG